MERPGGFEKGGKGREGKEKRGEERIGDDGKQVCRLKWQPAQPSPSQPIPMPVQSWRTGYGPSGGFAFSHETVAGILVYTKSVETNRQTISVEFVHGLRLKVVVYELYEYVWGHGLGLTKVFRGKRVELVGLAPVNRPPLEWY